MDLQSTEINEIAAALAKAQSSMETPKKDKKNPHFKNQYASLGSILSACKTSLNNNGISVSQQLSESSGKHYLVTTLMHASGQWIRSYMLMRLDDKATAQQLGSFLTYSKRYSLCAILGVDADEDDDGELASHVPQQKISEEQALNLAELIGDSEEDIEYLNKILSHYKASKLTEVALSNYAAIERSVKARRSKNEN